MQKAIKHSWTYSLRVLVAGALMGLANLVPGVSGGTMILACGVYEDFVGTVSAFTTARIKRSHVFFAALIAVSAGAVILMLAGPTEYLVRSQRAAMYSLFIGLAWGGIPLVWSQVSRWRRKEFISLGAALALMAVVALIKPSGGAIKSTPYFFLGGVLGSSAMVLPGISGAYVLMVMQLYEPILGAIHSLKQAISARTLSGVEFGVLIPVGVGVVAGIAAFSNAINFMLKRFRDPVTAFLLGLLIGAVFGLFPFDPVATAVSWQMPAELSAPMAALSGGASIVTPLQLAACSGLLVTGMLCSYGLSRIK